MSEYEQERSCERLEKFQTWHHCFQSDFKNCKDKPLQLKTAKKILEKESKDEGGIMLETVNMLIDSFSPEELEELKQHESSLIFAKNEKTKEILSKLENKIFLCKEKITAVIETQTEQIESKIALASPLFRELDVLQKKFSEIHLHFSHQDSPFSDRLERLKKK